MRSHAVAAVGGAPELNRDGHFLQALPIEEGPEGRVGEDSGLDARIMCRRSLGELVPTKLLAPMRLREFRAERDGFGEIRIAADQDKTRIASPRETEEPDTIGVELGAIGPFAQHVVDEAFDVGGPFHENGQIIGMPRLGPAAIAGMIDRCYHEAYISERLGGVMMSAEPTANAMRDDHERKSLARDRAALYGLDREEAEPDLSRRGGTRRPYCPFQLRASRSDWYVEKLQAGGLGKCRREAKYGPQMRFWPTYVSSVSRSWDVVGGPAKRDFRRSTRDP